MFDTNSIESELKNGMEVCNEIVVTIDSFTNQLKHLGVEQTYENV